MKLSKQNITTMLPGQTLTVSCDNAAELDSVKQVAYSTRRELGPDALKIYRSAKTMTVTITRR